VYDLVGPETVDMLGLVEMVARALRAAKLPIPTTRFVHVPWEKAPAELGLSKEEIDVMRCDFLGDPAAGPNALGYSLTPLGKAVEAAVAAEIGR
jgi:hypothetical protein